MYVERRVEVVSLEAINEPEAEDLYSQIESKVDLDLLVARLPAGYKKIAIMISEGYKKSEIVKECKVGYHTIEKVLRILKEKS
jgi:hypothetical protein